MIKAILFDMDDTLLHLNVDWSAVREKMNEYSSQYGIDIPPGILEGLIGIQEEKVKAGLFGIMDEYEANGWQDSYLLPHAKEVLDSLEGYSLAVVTGNGRKATSKVLEKHGLTEYFGAVVTREDGQKPLPDPIYVALERLGCEAGDAVFVGNGLNDARAASAAGVTAICLNNSYPEEELRKAGANKVIGDLLELKELIQ
ncbi:HAD family hydrolase [archaeon]